MMEAETVSETLHYNLKDCSLDNTSLHSIVMDALHLKNHQSFTSINFCEILIGLLQLRLRRST
jgi:hypothetical protein